MSRQTVLSFAKLMLLGAVSFWFPDSLWHAMTAKREIPGLLDLIVPTVSMPLALLGMYLVQKRQSVNRLAHGVGLPLILGIWTLGGFFLALGASFEGGGFAGPDGFRDAIDAILLALLPPYTFIMAAYDASLGALLLATIAAILIWLVSMCERSRRLWRQH